MTSRPKTSLPSAAIVGKLPRALMFDMDGTLTAPLLNFAQIKADMNIGSGPILEALAMLDEARRREAEAVLHRHEEIAAKNSTLNEGCGELLAWLAANGLGAALITRNTRLSVETVIRRHNLPMEIVITREDGPFKPSPIPLQLACQRLGVSCDEVWMVGDGQYDVEAAHAAGIRAVWISHRKPKEFSAEPWLTVDDLPELTAFLKSHKS